jgi:hypothetical protein
MKWVDRNFSPMTKRKPNADSKAVPKKRKYAPQSAIVMPGMGGILISCDRGASNKTVNEAMDLFQRQVC